jgi:hypothetical protein
LTGLGSGASFDAARAAPDSSMSVRDSVFIRFMFAISFRREGVTIPGTVFYGVASGQEVRSGLERLARPPLPSGSFRKTVGSCPD